MKVTRTDDGFNVTLTRDEASYLSEEAMHHGQSRPWMKRLSELLTEARELGFADTDVLALAAPAADRILSGFERKAEQVAEVNQWSLDHAKHVLLNYIADTDPDTARTLVTAIALKSRLASSA